MESLVYLDLATKQMTESLGGSRFNIPTLTFGEEMTMGIRFAKKTDGVAVEESRVVDELRATIGRVDERPESGTWGITFNPGGTDVTGLSHDIGINDFITALTNASLGLGAVDGEEKSGSLVVKFQDEDTASTPTPVSISVQSNDLFPVSFVRHRTFTLNDHWYHEFRLIQAPVASTSQSSRKNPPSPTIAAVRDGGTDADVTWNEIQELFVPPGFRGLYQIKRGSARTGLLDITDGISEVSNELNTAGLADANSEFIVTLPKTNYAHIEFAGDMGGTNQDLMEVEVFSAPEGDLTFTLDLDTVELTALLRKEEAITLPFEIEADIEDVNDSNTIYTRTLYSGEVTIQREVHWAELATAASIDWLRPPLPERYGGFDYSQVSNGQLHYTETAGDGIADPIVIDHNLDVNATDVIIKEISSGDLLVMGTDFDVNVTNTNSLTIFPAATVALNNWRVTVLGLEETSYFDPHTHPISDITNLQTTLDGLGTRITDLETLSGANAVKATFDSSASTVAAEWRLPTVFEVYPSRAEITDVDRLIDIDPAELERPKGLLPAIHDATTENLPSPLPTPAAEYEGRVFVATETVRLTGGKGIRSQEIVAGEYAACDGNLWYQVKNYGDGETVSFYPVPFERELFRLHVNERQFRVGKRFDLRFAIEAAVLNATSNAQWSLVIEQGSKTAKATPAGVGVNVDAISWDADPLFQQDIVVTPVSTVHRFGLWVDRESGSIDATALAYGASEAANGTITDANFAIRARLVRFDTEDSVSDPEGFVALKGFTLDGDIDNNEPQYEGFAYIN